MSVVVVVVVVVQNGLEFRIKVYTYLPNHPYARTDS